MAKGVGIQITEADDNYALRVDVKRNDQGQIVKGLSVASVLFQNQALILRTQPGQIKEFPTIGVGLEDILNDNEINYWKRKITESFELDGQIIESLNIDNTGLKIMSNYKKNER